MSSKRQAGFTIVELLIVIVVIAILAALSIVAYSGIQQRATDAAIASKESQVKKKLEAYKVEHEAYPASQSAFDSLIGQQLSDKHYTTYTSSSPYTTYTIVTSDGSTSALACATGFIPVPGNPTFSTSDFCVMKYEAKNVGGVATSQATNNPWVSISQVNAITAAQAACSGCHLITEAEWMTIAHNVASVPSNWSGGSVGSGFIYRGNSDNNPGAALAASNDDSDGYIGTNNSSGNGTDQLRTLTLTNGEVIWDFSGNVHEWIDQTTSGAGSQPGAPAGGGGAWRQWNAVGNVDGNFPQSRPSYGNAAAASWTTSNGIGSVWSSNTEAGLRAFRRGGNWGNGTNAGIFTLNTPNSPTSSATDNGFRVAR